MQDYDRRTAEEKLDGHNIMARNPEFRRAVFDFIKAVSRACQREGEAAGREYVKIDTDERNSDFSAFEKELRNQIRSMTSSASKGGDWQTIAELVYATIVHGL